MGIALSFASSRDAHLVKDIEKYTGQKVDVSTIKGLEPTGKKQKGPFHKKGKKFAKRGGPRKGPKRRPRFARK
jgi:hypothetical protein